MVQKINKDRITSSLVSASASLIRGQKGIEEQLGELLHDVQLNRIYGDGKTFVDMMPMRRVKLILAEYEMLRRDPTFDLREFISRHFNEASFGSPKEPYIAGAHDTADEHISQLWTFLERRNRITRGSLLALPYTYIVPGGRFNEQFYWDSYFIMLGLASEEKWVQVEDMIKNFAYQIRKYGYIPTANRSYLLSRSQPPFFSHMIELLASHKGSGVYREYLPYLLKEYKFWMRGRTQLAKTEHRAYRRVVQMPNGVVLNRYYDNKTTPRPESLREDVETAEANETRDSSRLYLHIRAAAESGWDFSSRWFLDPHDLSTIHTADIVPVDLNSLMYHLELTIARSYKAMVNPIGARTFANKAARRKETMNEYLWNDKQGFYRDYNAHHGKQTTVESLAGVFPLFVGIASQDQAERVAQHLKAEYLQKGGLLTTLVDNGQQWDAPNGWAPLQWVSIQGLKKYGLNVLADDIRDRWLNVNDVVYASSHKFIEKYNVRSEDGLGGGGEYELQDGFGWTNGVYAALSRERNV